MTKPAIDGFDRIAWIYDFLARSVYGKSIVKSQLCFLDTIPDGSRILILGGGTGWLLRELMDRKDKCEVCYVDASAKMIERAQRKNSKHTRIRFIHGTIENVPAQQFDVVVTHYFLDLFTEPELSITVQKIRRFCRAGTQWIAADFVDEGKWWQRLQLRAMYSFFGAAAGISTAVLPPWMRIMTASGLKKVGEQQFYGGFIHSISYIYPG